MNKLFKIIRIITVAPIAALITVILLFCFKQGFFVNNVHFAAAVLMLTVLPLSAVTCAQVSSGSGPAAV